MLFCFFIAFFVRRRQEHCVNQSTQSILAEKKEKSFIVHILCVRAGSFQILTSWINPGKNKPSTSMDQVLYYNSQGLPHQELNTRHMMLSTMVFATHYVWGSRDQSYQSNIVVVILFLSLRRRILYERHDDTIMSALSYLYGIIGVQLDTYRN